MSYKIEYTSLYVYSVKMLNNRYINDNTIEIGIDEAGRGSFWGHIMAGAVVIPPENEWTEEQRILLTQLRDSKKLSPKKRASFADKIRLIIPQTSIGIVTAEEININGITWANIEVFKRAVNGLGLANVADSRLLIDGTLSIPDWNGTQQLIIDGDDTYMAIAAASIIAKVEHDKWIQNYCIEYPECIDKYDLLKSKGYGTKNHRDGIKTYGAHELHRSLYIKNWLPNSLYKEKVKNHTTKKAIDNNVCLIKF